MALTKIRQEQGVVINEGSTDVDFRVESNGNANMLVIDGGDDVMSIGAAKSTSATVKIQNKDDANTNTLDLFNDNGNRTVSMQQDTTGNAKMKFQKNDGTVTTTIDANLGGILFGTDTAAANTLDDYEEGTWTPALTGSGGTSGVAYTTQVGGYTKVGRLVTANFHILLSDEGTITSTARISGLPFAGNNGPQYQATTFMAGNMAIDKDQQLAGVQYALNSFIYLFIQESDLAVAQMTGNGSFKDNTEIAGSITYFTAS